MNREEISELITRHETERSAVDHTMRALVEYRQLLRDLDKFDFSAAVERIEDLRIRSVRINQIGVTIGLRDAEPDVILDGVVALVQAPQADSYANEREKLAELLNFDDPKRASWEGVITSFVNVRKLSDLRKEELDEIKTILGLGGHLSPMAIRRKVRELQDNHGTLLWDLAAALKMPDGTPTPDLVEKLHAVTKQAEQSHESGNADEAREEIAELLNYADPESVSWETIVETVSTLMDDHAELRNHADADKLGMSVLVDQLEQARTILRALGKVLGVDLPTTVQGMDSIVLRVKNLKQTLEAAKSALWGN